MAGSAQACPTTATTATAARRSRRAAAPAWARPRLHTTMTSASESQPVPFSPPFDYCYTFFSCSQMAMGQLNVLGCMLAPGLHAAYG